MKDMNNRSIVSIVTLAAALMTAFAVSYIHVSNGEADNANRELSNLNEWMEDFNNKDINITNQNTSSYGITDEIRNSITEGNVTGA